MHDHLMHILKLRQARSHRMIDVAMLAEQPQDGCEIDRHVYEITVHDDEPLRVKLPRCDA